LIHDVRGMGVPAGAGKVRATGGKGGGRQSNLQKQIYTNMSWLMSMKYTTTQEV
jgi:hypothetical protein